MYSPVGYSNYEDMVTVYGAKVPKRAAASASKFMHAQTSYVSCVVLVNLISLIIGIIIYVKITSLAEDMSYIFPSNATTVTPQVNAAQGEPDSAAAAAQAAEVLIKMLASYYVWAPATALFCVCCCTGPATMFISRKFLTDANTGGLQFCCILDGCCSCCSFLSVLSLTSSAIAALTKWNLDANAICTHIHAAIPTGTTPAPRTVDTTDASFQKCITAVEGLHYVGILLAVNFGILACISCCIASICGGGSKFASDTKDALDEEYGRGDTQGYAQPAQGYAQYAQAY